MPDEAIANLPSVADARLPANYQAAKLALAECQAVDECQGWADRMAALASYARQIDDPDMAKYCRRIQARAVDRAGEILHGIDSATGAHLHPRGEGAPTVGRLKAAADAGMSRHQAITAVRVHNVPREEFERQVESENPPTVSELADQGKRAMPEPDGEETEPDAEAEANADIDAAIRLLEARGSVAALCIVELLSPPATRENLVRLVAARLSERP